MLTRPIVSVQMSGRQLANACGASYECGKDRNGQRTGPLAGYAGRDEQGRQKVGETYVDFAKIEQWPGLVARHIVPVLMGHISRLSNRPRDLVWCGMPEGGKSLATLLGVHADARYIFPDKKTLQSGDGKKDVTELVFARHEIAELDQVVIVEDVTNQFSTTDDALRKVRGLGGTVVAIASFLNRSPDHRDRYPSRYGTVPIFSVWNEAMPIYTQDDPFVAADIAAGNVVWEPKKSWELMRQQRLDSAA